MDRPLHRPRQTMHSCDNGLSVCQRVARMVKFVEMYVNVVFVKLFVHFSEFSSC